MSKFVNSALIAGLTLALTFSGPVAAQPTSQPAFTTPAAPAANAAGQAPFAAGVVLVGLQPDSNLNVSSLTASAATDLAALFPGVDVQGMEPVFAPSAELPGAGLSAAAPSPLQRIYRLRLAAGASVLQAVQTLRANPAVAYAEPDYVAHLITTTPDDPHYAEQWALPVINAPAAWDVVTGTDGVVIAVIDSGLDLDHPDLAAQLWVNPGEIASNSLDDDNNGVIDDVHGANIYGGNADLTDTTGHGTQVAGLIAAATNNGEGVAGVCWECRLMVVKVTQPGGIANYSDIAAGVAYAAQKGAQVINLSLGGLTDSSTLRAAIQAAAATAVIVAGAGNDNDDAPFYPAAYAEVIAVAGTSLIDAKVGTSNYGAWVDVSAPGEMITTTTDGGGYGLASGTSLAAPFVAGVAGLLRSQHPDWPAALVQAQILQTAEDIDALNDGYEGQLGHGRLDAAAAVTAVPTPDLAFADYAVNGQTHANLGTGTSVSLTVLLRNDWGPAAVVTGTLVSGSGQVTVTQATGNWGAIASGATVANAAGPFQVTVGAGASGLTVPFTLTVRADGVTSVVTFTATTAEPVVTVNTAISVDTVWTNDQVYNLTSHIHVNNGVTLTIEPGTVVKFNAGRALVVDGTLIADGTETEPILFTSNAPNPAPGDWGVLSGDPLANGGIFFLPTSVPAQFSVDGEYLSGSIIRYATIEYGTGLTINGAPYIDHNLIWKNGGFRYAVFVGRNISDDELRPVLKHNRIIANSHLAFGNDLRPVLLQQNLFANNGGGLSLSGQTNATPVVISNTISANGQSNDNCPTLSVLCIGNWNPLGVMHISGNNVAGNPANDYDLSLANSTKPITVTQNYWGSSNQASIQARIADDPLLPVTFVPFLNAPNPEAPAFLHQVSLDPASPVGIQQVSFELTFSAPMDQSIDPTVTFGVNAPYADAVVVDNATWLDATHWQATFDITSLIARDTHHLSVSGARGLDGLTIPTDTRFTFDVDYAGEITDQTPPTLASVAATGKTGDAGFVQAFWSGADDGGLAGAAVQQSASSTVIGYRYAIGSAAGATDIVSWTSTPSAGVTRNIPGLVNGHTYWISVQAQNTGGLWSAPSQASFVAGLQTLWWLYLPLAARN